MGNTEEKFFQIYGVTARSASSRAKRYIYVPELRKVVVMPTDATVMAQGDLSLLDYTAAHLFSDGMVLGNGRQTDLVRIQQEKGALVSLKESLLDEGYEMDAYRTPRITGCLIRGIEGWSQALHIIRSDEGGKSVRDCFAVEIAQPAARFVSTYAGPNVRPTPSFQGEPFSVIPLQGNADEMARFVYEAFAPMNGADDLRVSVVATVFDKRTGTYEVGIVNAVDV